jgi:hypothetical protein
MGSKDRDDKFASYLTAFAKNREDLSAIDAAITDLPVIDMTLSQSAHSNMIVVIPKCTVGAEAVTLQLWRLVTGYASTPTWTLVSTTVALTDGVEARFSNLLAAKYKIACSVISGVSTWDIYESHTEK